MQTAPGFQPGQRFAPPCMLGALRFASVTLGCEIRFSSSAASSTHRWTWESDLRALVGQGMDSDRKCSPTRSGSGAWGSGSCELATLSMTISFFFFSSKAKTADLYRQRAYQCARAHASFGERNRRNFLRRSNLQAVEIGPV